MCAQMNINALFILQTLSNSNVWTAQCGVSSVLIWIGTAIYNPNACWFKIVINNTYGIVINCLYGIVYSFLSTFNGWKSCFLSKLKKTIAILTHDLKIIILVFTFTIHIGTKPNSPLNVLNTLRRPTSAYNDKHVLSLCSWYRNSRANTNQLL